jgi:uncharacterized protein YecT (DUF1311 family)
MTLPNNKGDTKREGGFAFTATHATVIAAIVAAIGTAFGAFLSAHESLKLEEAKHNSAAELARQEFETKLIFRAIEGSDSADERTRNLKFFLDAGFLSDPDHKIQKLNPDQYPSKGNASFDCSTDRDAAAKIICGDPTLSARDQIMASHYYKLRQALNEPARTQLIQEQRRWLTERNNCAAIPATAVTCLAEKYDVRIVQLLARIPRNDAVVNENQSDTPVAPAVEVHQ